MAGDGDKFGAVGDNPKFDENKLSQLVVTAAFFAAIGLLFAAWWVFTDASGNSILMTQRAATVAPFMLAGGAVVTYFTVLWRGAIQKRQISEHARENDGRELAEHGLMLHRATEFLRADDLHTRGVGVTMLHSVVDSRNKLYAAFAAETAADQIVPAFNKGGDGLSAHLGVIYSTLLRAWELGVGASAWREYKFRNQSVFEDAVLVLNEGLPPGQFYNAVIWVDSLLYNLMSAPDAPPWLFSKCLFKKPDGYFVLNVPGFNIEEQFINCQFDGVIVSSLDTAMPAPNGSSDKFHTFNNCDFSSAEISGTGEFSRNTFDGCFFSAKAVPSVPGMTKDELRYWLTGISDNRIREID
jgi:hypothetical protein